MALRPVFYSDLVYDNAKSYFSIAPPRCITAWIPVVKASDGYTFSFRDVELMRERRGGGI